MGVLGTRRGCEERRKKSSEPFLSHSLVFFFQSPCSPRSLMGDGPIEGRHCLQTDTVFLFYFYLS
jgi:hypothetical protein